MAFGRYGIYWLPDGPLGAAGAEWLGWDIRRGTQAPGAGPQTERPRRYGFHATMKPPFRLAEGRDAEGLSAALAAFGQTCAPVPLGRLEVARTGRFLALRPARPKAGTDLAATVVRQFDGFRAPPPPEEVARREAAGLTDAQGAHLHRWGYPFVMDAFRFHVTLTGRDPTAETEAAARARLGPVLGAEQTVAALSLVGEDDAGRFHLVREVALTGRT